MTTADLNTVQAELGARRISDYTMRAKPEHEARGEYNRLSWLERLIAVT